ncbi:MAG: metal ABC transporter substrate-binding protein [bacterium]|nr:metal ABC transporter substrate-binding protein [bacterium]
MKNIKIKALIMMMLVMSLLVGCSSKASTEKDVASDDGAKKLKVVTTIYAPFDFARQVAKDNADITLLLKPGAESHSYEPTPQDIIAIQNCDVFVYVGGENDKWVDKVLDSIDNKDMKIIKLLDCVTAVEEEHKEGMQDAHGHEEDADHDDDHEDADHEDDHEEEHELDEHVWTSPKNAIAISKKMEQVFSELDQENAEVYSANLASYVSELEKLDQAFTEVVSTSKRKMLIFGDRFPLRYFVDAYGLDYYAAFSGCSTDTEVSAGTIAFLTDKIKDEKVPVVFKIELSSGNIANSIADSTGAKVLTFYACHNISKDDYEAGMTYTDFMWKNVDTLKEALN